jgi:hypothetical protein
MLTKKSTFIIIVTTFASLFLAWLLLAVNCPNAGIALTSRARALHRLKNRTGFPEPKDFDARVTLDSLLQPGDDSRRWSTNNAARIQGLVIDVAYARPEATNCFSPCRRDIHLVLAQHEDAAKSEQVIVEVTPNLRQWASTHSIDWSEETLRKQLIGHHCEFEGWLYFDAGHEKESENTAPHDPQNWRATAWELHPVTKIEVIR